MAKFITIKSKACPLCGKVREIEVDPKDYEGFIDGTDSRLVQDIFPYLSADDRESLQSGLCPDCWDKLFGGEEEGE